MDLVKLVALGEKMGLSGAELRKWVSQKEKEVAERERLAAERAKEEREAEMAERERQRQHEIELERLRLQQRIEAPDQARVESNTTQEYGALRELLIKERILVTCHPSLSLYLKERKAKSFEDMLELADQFFGRARRHESGQSQKGWLRGFEETCS
ncbi:hypothetical protein MTO96_044724 [Rhipicephalus appendiculatus]